MCHFHAVYFEYIYFFAQELGRSPARLEEEVYILSLKCHYRFGNFLSDSNLITSISAMDVLQYFWL